LIVEPTWAKTQWLCCASWAQNGQLRNWERQHLKNQIATRSVKVFDKLPLAQIEYINRRSFLPELFEMTAPLRARSQVQTRTSHSREAEALGDTPSRDAVGILISAIPSAKENNKLPATIEALKPLTRRLVDAG
jgi:hypothetical protein